MTTHINLTPKYPGDHIRIMRFQRGPEIGDVRVQYYGPDSYRVGSFTPGYETSSPGDTPKMNADYDQWCSTPNVARAEFEYQCARAKAEGWIEI